jgi:effector-binding domain-containing protein
VQKLLYGVAALIALLVVIGFALPRTHEVQVSIEIHAHPATVFALLNDFRRHELWSPLVDSDPNVRMLFSGNENGVGATMSWDGAIVGSGTQTIVESKPYDRIRIVVNPGEPGEAESRFDLAAGTGTTIVSWRFEADYGTNIAARYCAAILGRIVARDYESGLANLKELAESLPSADFGDAEIEHMTVEAIDIAYVSTTSRPEPTAVSDALGDAYFQVLNFIDAHGLQVAGAPLSITRTYSGAELVFDAAIPVRGVTDATPRDATSVKIGRTYAGPVIRIKHVGSYRTLSDTHRRISAYLAAHGIERNGATWESYVTDPGNVPEEDLLTYIYYPVKPI